MMINEDCGLINKNTVVHVYTILTTSGKIIAKQNSRTHMGK